MHNLYQSDKDYQVHLSAIQSLAMQYQLKDEEVRNIYEEALEKLQLKATCKNFLSILVTKHVKEIIENNILKNQNTITKDATIHH